MKRSINIPALVLLVIACAITSGVILWLWQLSQMPPDEIRCGHGGHSVMSCGTDFGNHMVVVALIAAPTIAGLVHKAFFTDFKRSK